MGADDREEIVVLEEGTGSGISTQHSISEYQEIKNHILASESSLSEVLVSSIIALQAPELKLKLIFKKNVSKDHN